VCSNSLALSVERRAQAQSHSQSYKMTTMSPGWRIYLWLIGVHAAMFLVIFVVLFFPDWLDEVFTITAQIAVYK